MYIACERLIVLVLVDSGGIECDCMCAQSVTVTVMIINITMKLYYNPNL